MPCDLLELTDDEREPLIDWEHGDYPGCPLPYSPALGHLDPENVLLWTLYQQAKVLTWETVWQLTTLRLTAHEAETMRDLLAYVAACEQSMRQAPAEEQRT